MVGSLCQTELTLCKLSTAPLRERRGLLRALGVLWAGKRAKPGGYHVPSKPSRGGIRVALSSAAGKGAGARACLIHWGLPVGKVGG